VAFRPHLSMGLALSGYNLMLPTEQASSRQEIRGHIFILFSMRTSVLEVNGLEENTRFMKEERSTYVKKNRRKDPIQP
jgi:hypothetical protein